jgi:hypothetical protein
MRVEGGLGGGGVSGAKGVGVRSSEDGVAVEKELK